MEEHEFQVLTTCHNLLVSAENVECYGPKEEVKAYQAIRYLLEETNRRMSSEEYDLIFSSRAIFASIFPAWLLSILGRKPWVADCDDYEWYGPIHSRLGPPLIRFSDMLIVASKELQRFIGGIYIPNTVDTGVLDPSNYDGTPLLEKYGVSQEKIAIWSGTMVYTVNLRFLANLSKKLEESDVDIHFVIIGDGPNFNELRGMLPSNLKKTTFTGWVKRSELYRWYSIAHVGIIPFSNNLYSWCKCPIKLFDYMAMELAVFTTPVGEPRYMVEKLGCGEICSDEEEMLDKIETQSLSELRRKGKRGRSYLRKRTWERQAKKVNRIFEYLVSLDYRAMKLKRINSFGYRTRQ